jgi:hypothetical protein
MGFKAPEAELIDAQGRLFAKQYAGPSWEAADGSKIVGKVLANEPAPKAGAIPWLLLSTESSGLGGTCRRAFRPTGQHLRRGRGPAHVRPSAQSSVSITRPTTSFTSDY